MSDFPTLGLKFDLREIVGGAAKLEEIERLYRELGQAAEQAKAKEKERSAAAKQAGVEGEAAAQKTKKASDSATATRRRETQAINETIQKLQLLNKVARALQLEQDAKSRFAGIAEKKQAQAVDDLTRRLQQQAQFQAKMTAQRGREAAAEATAYNTSAREVMATMQLRARMAKQRAVEEAAAEALVIAALKERQAAEAKVSAVIAAAADWGMKKSAEVTTFELRMAKQREAAIAEESRAYQAAQALKIQAAVSRTVGPGPLSAQDRARRQADLDAAFNAVPAGKSGSGLGGLLSGILGLKGGFSAAASGGGGFISMLQRLGQATRSVRLTLLDARFAIAAMMAAFTLGPLAAMADQMTALESRTKIFAARATDVPFILEKTYLVAQQARQPLEGIATLYTRLAPLSAQLGRSQSQLLDVVETVAKSFTIGGAAASEATASAQQFAQALSSNRFGGDELRSVAENAPILLQAIAEGVNKINPALNLNAATFIKWAQKGNANSALLVKALENSRAKIDAIFKTMPMTISQAGATLSNAIRHTVARVDELAGSGGLKLSQQIALTISKFTGFLESEKFINGATTALKGMQAIMSATGTAAKFLVDNLKPLGAILAGIAAARLLSAGLGLLPGLFALIGAGATASTARLYAFSTAQAAVQAGVTKLLTPLRALYTMMGGPLGIALTAGVLLFTAFAKAQRDAAQASSKFKENQQSAVGAVDRAITAAAALGLNTDKLTNALHGMVTATGDGAAATKSALTPQQQALQLAQDRAKAEQALTVSILRRAAIEAGDDARKADRSVNGLFGLKTQRAAASTLGQAGAAMVPGGNGPVLPKAATPGLDKQIAEAQEAARKGYALQAEMNALADSLAKQTPVVTAPANGSGISTLPPADDKGARSLAKRMERLDAEITKSRDATTAIRAELAARQALSVASDKFYGGGMADLQGYTQALNRYQDAALKAKIVEEQRNILAMQDAKSLGDLTGAERARTEQLMAQKAVELTTADAAERMKRALDVRDQIQETIAQTDAYTAALDRLKGQLVANEIAQRAYEIVRDSQGAISATEARELAVKQIQSDGLRVLAERADARKEELRLAVMSTTQASLEEQVHQRALELQRANVALTYEEAQARARVLLALERQQGLMAGLKKTLQDAIEQSFVDTGKIDFKSLKEAVTRALRQSIYDALIAKPIQIVVNAVVNVLTKGLEELLGKIIGASNGAGGPSSGLGAMMDKSLSKLSGSLKSVFAKLPTQLQGALKFVGQSAGYAAVGSTITSALGVKQNTTAMVGSMAGSMLGMYLGGPIGAVIGAALGSFAGSLLGGKPSNHATLANLTPGSYSVQTTNKSNSETMKLADAAGAAIIASEKALTDLGVKLGTTVSQVDIGQRDKTAITLSDGTKFRTNAVGDAAEAADAAMKKVLESAIYVDETQKKLATSMLAAGSSFDDIAKKLQAYAEAQDFYKSVDRAMLQYTNPTQYSLANLRDQQVARRKQVKDYGAQGLLTPEQLTALNTKLSELEKLEIVDTLNKLADSAGGAAASLDKIKDAQKQIIDYVSGLRVSSLSPLSPAAQLQQSGNQFFQALQAARGGDLSAMQNITSLSDSYLNQARGFYGSSSSYSAIFDTVSTALEQLGTQAFADPMVGAVEQATKDLIAALGENFATLNDQLAAQTEALVAAQQAAANSNATAAATQAATTLSLTGGRIVA